MMKQKLTILCLIVVSLMFSTNSLYAKEDSIITFDGDAKKFVYVHDDAKGFTNFEGLLPGETRTQTITLKNEDYQELRFYLSSKILDTLGGDVKNKVIYDIDFLIDGEPLFQGTVGGQEEVGMNDSQENLLIATLQKGQSVELTMTLTTDGDSMENEYQGSQGTVQFTFSVEHDDTLQTPIPVVNTVVNYVNHAISTGDTTALMTLLATAGASICLFIILIKRKGGTKNVNK